MHLLQLIHTCIEVRQKFLPFKSSSVVDSRRNPLDIRISSVVDDLRLICPAIFCVNGVYFCSIEM